MPCSPDSTPPAATHAREDLVARRRARAPRCPGSRASKTISGCRLPSPAWNTFIIVRSLLGGDRVDLAQHLDELRARHDRVVQVVVGRDAGDRAERRLAALPQQRPLGLVGRDPHRAGAVRAADALDRRDLRRRRRRAGRRPRRAAPRRRRAGSPAPTKSSTARVISASIISSAAGTIAGGDDPAHRRAGVLDRREVEQQRAHARAGRA